MKVNVVTPEGTGVYDLGKSWTTYDITKFTLNQYGWSHSQLREIMDGFMRVPAKAAVGKGMIYLLVDPRTSLPFWVGQTLGADNNLRNRYIDHMCLNSDNPTQGLKVDHNPLKVTRIMEIRNAGMVPRFLPVKWDLPERALNTCEGLIIKDFAAKGYPLTNLTSPPIPEFPGSLVQQLNGYLDSIRANKPKRLPDESQWLYEKRHSFTNIWNFQGLVDSQVSTESVGLISSSVLSEMSDKELNLVAKMVFAAKQAKISQEADKTTAKNLVKTLMDNLKKMSPEVAESAKEELRRSL